MEISESKNKQETLEELAEMYKDYEYSEHFIRCAFTALDFKKQKTAICTIHDFFKKNNVNNCRIQTIKGVIKKIEHFAQMNLKNEEYEKYASTINRLTNLQITLHKMENEIYYEFSRDK